MTCVASPLARARSCGEFAPVEQRYLDGVAHALLRACGPKDARQPPALTVLSADGGAAHLHVHALPSWWRGPLAEPASLAEESAPPPRGADLVFLRDCLELSWERADSARGALERALRLAAPGGVVLGTTCDGGTLHRRYEESRRGPGGAWTLEDGRNRALMTTRFGGSSGRPGAWPDSGVYGPAFQERWGSSPPEGWECAVDRDELVRLAERLGARCHVDAHGLVPSMCWNMQEWFCRAGQPVHRAVQDGMTVEGWDALASRAVFAFDVLS